MRHRFVIDPPFELKRAGGAAGAGPGEARAARVRREKA